MGMSTGNNQRLSVPSNFGKDLFDLDELTKAENQMVDKKKIDASNFEKNKKKGGLFNTNMPNVKNLLQPFKNIFN